MSLSDDFNQNGYNAQMINGFVLGVCYSNGGGSSIYHTYDFMARVMVTRTGSSDGGTVVTPFSKLDRGALIAMRDALVDLGGKPPELPPEESATSAPQKKLNL